MGKKILYFVGWLALSFPLTFVLGILEAPLAGRFEDLTSIESLGHSGPADWVYFVNFVLFVLIGVYFIFLRTNKRNKH